MSLNNGLNEKERIFVTGPGGVGKTTYAKNLATKKNIKHFQLDDIRYPNGKKLSNELFIKRLQEVVSTNSWIIEGTLKNTQDIIFPRCTKIIVLTAPRLVCTFRTIKRSIKRGLGIEKSETFDDFKNLFSKDFIVFWVWRHYPRYVRQIDEALEDIPHSAEVIKKRI